MSKDLVKVVARNRKARHTYEFIDKYEAGLVLTGSEVKVLRNGKGNIGEAYVRLRDEEAWLIGANFPPYLDASYNNHEPDRPRKLLLKKKELKKLRIAVREKGLTLVPLELRFKGAWCKLEFALARGRKSHDKRQALRKKEHRRDLDRKR
ncbi:MAG: SsrA-binding protein SmpB [Proteobacteria bacterium]|nr:SsrA-binding protein SmpB [Pseudomonadota bacterium]MCP4916097.1 SsrA-binding protein SmpB [Pseudomonadota bacterium]